MNSPAPNNPGAASAMSPPTEYMNELELELEATSEDDIGAGDETLSLFTAKAIENMKVVDVVA
jgi:hypothetical protein